MYENMAQAYEHLFPLSRNQLQLVTELFPPPKKILDLGCGTGELLRALGTLGGYQLEGRDLSPSMIEVAREKAKQSSSPLTFRPQGLLELDDYESWDGILCLGNTLPHLKSLEELTIFFQKVFRALLPGSSFLLQLLNYQKILKNGFVEFPVLENGPIRLIRNYSLIEPDQILFETKVFFQEKVYQNQMSLYPFSSDHILSCLKLHPFKNIQVLSPDDPLDSSPGPSVLSIIASKN